MIEAASQPASEASPRATPPAWGGMRGMTRAKILLAVFDAASVLIAFYLSFHLRNYLFAWRGGIYEARAIHALFALGLVFLTLMVFRHRQLYRATAMSPTAEHLENVMGSWARVGMLFIALCFFFKIQLFISHRISTAFFLLLGAVGLFAGRFLLAPPVLRHLFAQARCRRRALLIATGGDREAAAREVRALKDGPELAGFVSDDGVAPEGVPHWGGLQDLETLIRERHISEAYVWLGGNDREGLVTLLRQLRGVDIELRVAAAFDALRAQAGTLSEARGRFLYFNLSPFARLDRIVKRALDLAVAGALLVLLAPGIALIALWIRLDSRGGVFFRQRRVGCEGREFDVIKFRTMRANTEQHHLESLRTLMDERKLRTAEGLFKAVDNDMVTRAGRFLRRYSLDELPQLMNVWRGEMSLVGPRPLPTYQVAMYKPWQHFRHAVKPGMTGYWQVNGRSTVSHDDMVLMDIYYIANWSLGLDLDILFKTLWVVLTGKGAV